MSNYLKGIVAGLTAIPTALAPFYGSTHWFPVVTAVITIVLVVLVPNVPTPPKPTAL